jgi:hypothetical protein
MFQIFRAHVDKFIEIDDQEFEKISSFFRLKNSEKGRPDDCR